LTDIAGEIHAGVWKDGTLIDLFALPAENEGSIAERRDVAVKAITVFTGLCRFQLITGFFPCDSKVAYVELENGRSVVTFMKGDVLFSLSGGKIASQT
jgi:hypothetical protein